MIECERYWTILQQMQCELNNLLHLFNISFFQLGQLPRNDVEKDAKNEQEKRELWQSRSRR